MVYTRNQVQTIKILDAIRPNIGYNKNANLMRCKTFSNLDCLRFLIYLSSNRTKYIIYLTLYKVIFYVIKIIFGKFYINLFHKIRMKIK